jgi:hypothetical protein
MLALLLQLGSDGTYKILSKCYETTQQLHRTQKLKVRVPSWVSSASSVEAGLKMFKQGHTDIQQTSEEPLTPPFEHLPYAELSLVTLSCRTAEDVGEV